MLYISEPRQHLFCLEICALYGRVMWLCNVCGDETEWCQCEAASGSFTIQWRGHSRSTEWHVVTIVTSSHSISSRQRQLCRLRCAFNSSLCWIVTTDCCLRPTLALWRMSYNNDDILLLTLCSCYVVRVSTCYRLDIANSRHYVLWWDSVQTWLVSIQFAKLRQSFCEISQLAIRKSFTFHSLPQRLVYE